MGNKLGKENKCINEIYNDSEIKYSTPKKINKSLTQNDNHYNLNENINEININNLTNKSPDFNLKKRDSLYSEEKLFENYENSNIYGMRLDSDPEIREYYFDCPKCGKLLLDKGINKEIK